MSGLDSLDVAIAERPASQRIVSSEPEPGTVGSDTDAFHEHTLQDSCMPPLSGTISDAERFLAHIEPLRNSLLAYSRQAVWSMNDVEDVLQTALTTALASFPAYQEGTNFRAWIFKHLQHAAWSCNRRRRNLGMAELNDQVQPHGRDRVALDHDEAYQHLLTNPDALYDHFDERIRSALLGLPERERTVLLLRAIGDFSYREIAGITDLPIGSVMTYLSRARCRMRERLSGQSGPTNLPAQEKGTPR